MSPLRIVVLLAAGVNPDNGRMRRSPLDARALELILGFREAHPGTALEAIHAGDGDSVAALRDYMGMGLESLTLLETASDNDAVAILANYLLRRDFDLVVTGAAALDGAATGVVPYQLSQVLGMPVLPEITALDQGEHALIAMQARERGVRQRFEIAGPAIVTVSPLAPAARLPAYVRSREGEITRVSVGDQEAIKQEVFSLREPAWRPAAPMRKALSTVDPNASPEERLRAVTALKGGAGKLQEGLTAEQIASEILERLNQAGLYRSSSKELVTGDEKQ